MVVSHISAAFLLCSKRDAKETLVKEWLNEDVVWPKFSTNQTANSGTVNTVTQPSMHTIIVSVFCFICTHKCSGLKKKSEIKNSQIGNKIQKVLIPQYRPIQRQPQQPLHVDSSASRQVMSTFLSSLHSLVLKKHKAYTSKNMTTMYFWWYIENSNCSSHSVLRI